MFHNFLPNTQTKRPHFNRVKKQNIKSLKIYFLFLAFPCLAFNIHLSIILTPWKWDSKHKTDYMRPFLYLIHFFFLLLLQVYIVGHIPPGSDERQVGSLPNGHTTFSEKNNLRYLRLVQLFNYYLIILKKKMFIEHSKDICYWSRDGD